MIAWRKLFQVFGRGSLTFLNPSNRKILAYLRDLDLSDGPMRRYSAYQPEPVAQPVELDFQLRRNVSVDAGLRAVSHRRDGVVHFRCAVLVSWLELSARRAKARGPRPNRGTDRADDPRFLTAHQGMGRVPRRTRS